MKSTKTRKIQTRSIVVPILNDEYKVVVCWGGENWIEKVLTSWGHENIHLLDLENMRGQTFWTKDCAPVIVLRHRPKTGEEIGALAHEAVHAVSWIFDRIEEESRSEVFAHSVGAIVRKVMSNKLNTKDISK